MPENCPCGFTQNKNDYSSKRQKCPVTTALQNHITFPCLELLNDYYNPSKFYMKFEQNENMFGTDPGKPRRHWALLVDIKKVTSHCGIGYDGLNIFGEFTQMNYFTIAEKPTTFSFDDIKKGKLCVHSIIN